MPSNESAPRVPKYRRHKPTGQAVVTLSGKDIYLGKWGSAASKAQYQRLTGEWLANGGYLPSGNDTTVAELCRAYWLHAKEYYPVRKGGSRGALDRVRLALRPLRKSYAQCLAKDFGPLALQAVQQQLAESGNSRPYVNDLVQTISEVALPPLVGLVRSTMALDRNHIGNGSQMAGRYESVTIKQAAEVTGVSPNSLIDRHRTGKMPDIFARLPYYYPRHASPKTALRRGSRVSFGRPSLNDRYQPSLHRLR